MFQTSLRRRALTFCLLILTALLCAPVAIADLDEDCVLREVRNGEAAMTLAELRSKCRAAPTAADGALAASVAETGDTESAGFSPVEERLSIEQELVDRPFTIMAHKPNYFLAAAYNERGWASDPFQEAGGPDDYRNDDVEAQFEISLKVPLAVDLFGGRMDVFGAYTNRSFWQMYNDDFSRPFRETNHEPELWGQFPNDWEIWGFTNSVNRIGIVHQSNGRGGSLSRSWNRVYANFIFEKGRWAISLKPWIRLPEDADKDDNPDITDYLGHGELRVLYRRHGHVFGLMTRNQVESGFDEGALELSWSFPVFDYPYLKGYIQYFHGYGESLVDYDRRVNRIGIGIALTDWLE
ncbi:MAG: phospholipase A [Xanthomonadales bacterium]|jgi:phospholipase A1|nr:phospholipase A [Xanthomonadales bacterium]